ncbi:VOC family protein [Mycobacterium sp. PSTR-4-N]|uniref:VOC family protein n=1 Tax=Mycobacterium sp. PSTR-4-N TaxID=2917745 RepID=UPI001F15298A|nr:VOC family protein [Mycobacterium sp. PSTR-4-N]MCG7596395.1 VOC family protein [Mycobacterium sp. PSTR-4-N]
MTQSNPAVWPTLQAHDAPALIDYLVDTFGFVVGARYGDDDRVDHAQLNWPEGTGGLMMGSYKPGTDWCREPGSAGAYIVTADVDALYTRVVSKNADIVRPLCSTDYGSREFAVRDPEGNLWSFGTYAGEVSETEPPV